MTIATLYSSFQYFVGNRTINLVSDQFKIALVQASYTFAATHTTWSQVSDHEVIGGYGYTVGGLLLQNVNYSQVGAVSRLDCDDIIWTATDGPIGPAQYAVVYDNTTVDKKLVVCFDFEQEKTADINTNFRLTVNPNGLIEWV
jgi:hypothetical protein